MSAELETFEYKKLVPLVDADKRPIREGSVLRHITDGTRGVVTVVVRPGAKHGPMFSSVGDIGIETRPGSMRVSNRYSEWQHIPQAEQTYRERYLSWMQVPFDHELGPEDISRDQALAIDGIMALLPPDTVDWDFGPTPDRLENALRFLMEHLEDLNERITDPRIYQTMP